MCDLNTGTVARQCIEALLPTISRVIWDLHWKSVHCLLDMDLPQVMDVDKSFRQCSPEVIPRPMRTVCSVPASLVSCCAGWFLSLAQKQQGIKLLLKKDSHYSPLSFKYSTHIPEVALKQKTQQGSTCGAMSLAQQKRTSFYPLLTLPISPSPVFCCSSIYSSWKVVQIIKVEPDIRVASSWCERVEMC